MADKKEAAALVAGAAGGSVLTYLATRKAQAAPPGVDPEFWAMLQALIDSINQLVAALGGAPVGEDPFASAPSFTTGHVVCSTVLQGFQLPSIVIPKNKQLVVKAHPGNVTWIYVARIQADSQNIGVAYILVPNEGLGLSVQNANAVWVMATTINDTAIYTVEQT